jgi:GNAT superfamily N-acetyltransferase
MKPDYPKLRQIPGLRKLWKEAFGDSDAFLDLFFASGFSPDRCRCIANGDEIAAVCYWFDITCEGQKLAYVYAVATAKASRGQGLCRKLLADCADLLKAQGYSGILLVPQDEGLIRMYGGMGYLPATRLGEALWAAGDTAAPLRELTPEEYTRLREGRLPPFSALQEGPGLTFLGTQARFYEGPDFLTAVSRETEHLRILEYLGDTASIPSFIRALGHREATVRLPGDDRPYGMYLPLTADCKKPEYFAFSYD